VSCPSRSRIPIRDREVRRFRFVVFAGWAFFAGFDSIFALEAIAVVFVDFFAGFRFVDFLVCFELRIFFRAIIRVPEES
jgi:hypothetical protein